MQDLFDALKAHNLKLVTAESCTGGMIVSAITALPGASEIFERGFITYSNAAKTECLAVPAEIIEKHGAVSAEVAEAMAKGALENSHAGIALAITGIAGPDGGTDEKPVGLVYSGYATKDKGVHTLPHQFKGSRHDIQKQAAIAALRHLLQILKKAND